jgi:hydrogenase maturation protease
MNAVNQQAAPGKTLLVGLGSPYGDDQLGWRLVAAVEQCFPNELVVRRAGSAADLLNWLDDVERLVVCDACHGAGPVGSWHRWSWPADNLAPLVGHGSHDLGLSAVLTLAERLGQLPSQVTIWAIEARPALGTSLSPDDSISPELELAITHVSRLIAAELTAALAP